MNTTQSTTITTATLPGCTPRLLNEQAGQAREDVAAYRRLGGYRPLADAEALLSEVESSGLVGRGGAAFPLAVKLRTVRDNGRLIADTGGTVVIANGEEGEPASVKDRWLLRSRREVELLIAAEDGETAKQTAIGLCTKVFSVTPAPGVITFVSRGTDDDAFGVLAAFGLTGEIVRTPGHDGFDIVHVTLREADLERIPESRVHTALEASLNCEVHIFTR